MDQKNINYIPFGVDLNDFQQNHEWDIMGVPAERHVIKKVYSQYFYTDITFSITLRRKTLFYTFNLIIPCVGISFLTVLVFYLPSESSEKMSLCTFILVSLTFFVLLLYDLMPPTSLVVPLIGKYILFTVILVTLSILSSVIVLNVHYRSPTTHSMPNWTRIVFLNALPKLLFMKTPQPTLSAKNLMDEIRLYSARHKQVSNNIESIVGEHTSICARKNNFSFTNIRSYKSLYLSKSKPINPQQLKYFLDKEKALSALDDIVKHVKKEHDEKRVKYLIFFINSLALIPKQGIKLVSSRNQSKDSVKIKFKS